MEITIKSRHGKVSTEERTYLEHKLQKLARYADGITTIIVELRRVVERNSGQMHIAQATLHAPHGILIRAEERDGEFSSTVDALHDHLQRQLTRYKDRRFRRGQIRGADTSTLDSLSSANGAADGRDAGPQVVRTKQFIYKPMSSDEAIEQMELLGHDFFVYTNDANRMVNVVYRRKDGNYGLIEPDVEAEA